MLSIEEMSQKLRGIEAGNLEKEEDAVETEKPFHKRPIPKLILTLSLFLPVSLIGLSLGVNSRTKVVRFPEENQGKKYSQAEIDKLNQKIFGLKKELFESNSDLAFLASKQSVKPKQDNVLIQSLPEKKIKVPAPPPPQTKVSREYNFSSPKVTRTIGPEKNKVFGSVVIKSEEPTLSKEEELSDAKVSTSYSGSLTNPQNRQIEADLGQTALIQEMTLGKIQRGQKVKAVLSNPIVLSEDGEVYNSIGISIVLLEPLKSSRGEVLVRENTEISVACRPFGQMALVTLKPIAIMGRSELAIPEQKILISGLKGPIAPEPFAGYRRKFSGNDAAQIAEIALEELAPDNGIVNTLGALLGRRNSRAANNYRNSEDLSIVPAGLPLELKVIGEFEVPVILGGNRVISPDGEVGVTK